MGNAFDAFQFTRITWPPFSFVAPSERLERPPERPGLLTVAQTIQQEMERHLENGYQIMRPYKGITMLNSYFRGSGLDQPKTPPPLFLLLQLQALAISGVGAEALSATEAVWATARANSPRTPDKSALNHNGPLPRHPPTKCLIWPNRDNS